MSAATWSTFWAPAKRANGNSPWCSSAGWWRDSFRRITRRMLFLPDAARRHLRQSGFRLRTTEEWAGDETVPFRFRGEPRYLGAGVELSAHQCSRRAQLALVVSGVRRTSRCRAELVRPRPARAPAVSRPSRIAASDLFPVLAARHATFSPTGLESFQQCPFQFFGRATLKLKEAPPRPEKRMDPRVQGSIVHTVLAEWFVKRGPIDPVFDRDFRASSRTRESIPNGYRTEVYRTQMRDDLRRFAEDTTVARGFQSGDGARV